MKLALPLSAAAALLALSACNNGPEVVDSRAPDPNAEAVKNAPKVELPPAIAASVTLRCADNSLIYVDFLQGDKMAYLRTEKGGTPTTLTAPEAGQPYAAEGGYKLTGTPKSVTVEVPGKPSRSCKA